MDKTDNPFGLKEKDSYYIVKLESLEGLIGFEDEDPILRNFI